MLRTEQEGKGHFHNGGNEVERGEREGETIGKSQRKESQSI
jgi:hypothetical protein